MSLRQLLSRFLVVSMFMIAASIANAQDIIVKIDGDEVKAKVVEITENTIKYHKATNLNGPIYSIPISSVSVIRYGNGEIDNFNALEKNYLGIASTQSATNGFTANGTYSTAKTTASQNNQETVSDTELTKLYYSYSGNDYTSLMNKSQTYKKTAWIGGASLAVIGIILGIGLDCEFYPDDIFREFYLTEILGAVGIGAGAIWCVSFNIAANNLIKKAQLMEMSSANIYQNEIIGISGTKLFAGVNLFNNHMTQERALGVSLKLSF